MLRRILEIIFGLQHGFLSRQGDFSLTFNPTWPGGAVVGPASWNIALGCLALALVIFVYRREGGTRNVRVVLGLMRAVLLGLVIALLNRPLLTLTQSHAEPSVLAVMIDDSISMRVPDADSGADASRSRLIAATSLLSAGDASLMHELGKTHELRLYRFDSSAVPLAPTTRSAEGEGEALSRIQAVGQSTEVGGAIRNVLDDLQGQHIAGVVVFTDGRDTPATPLGATLAALQDAGVKVYPVVVGSDRMPTNLSIASVIAQDSAFKDDIVNVRVQVRGSGFEPGKTVLLDLKDKKTGMPLNDPTGKPVQALVTLEGENPTEAELQFKPTEVGEMDLLVEAAHQPGEIDEADNTREIQMSILAAKLNVLYVDGYPRWDYRYLKTEMIRDATVDISCLLTSADANFKQEGDRPITRFPETLEEMLDYDVVLFGDVDPRQFSDAQLQLVSDFVAKRGGGFGMVAGPRYAPQAFRGTPIEAILPVNISRVQTVEDTGPITEPFHLAITKDGSSSSIFRFFPDKAENESYLKNALQPMFWYCRGITTKPGVGEVYAEHPMATGPDGRKAPILVLGRYGAGRTMFSAIDDSWRWRYQSGESVFDIYWVQQLRNLARSRKLGQRKYTLSSARPIYELGEQVHIGLRVLDPQLLTQLPETIRADVTDDAGQVVRQENLRRSEDQSDVYSLSYSADRVGKFQVKLPAIAGGGDPQSVPIEVSVPQLELSQPQVDRASMAQIASETHGQLLDLANARAGLLKIPSAAKVIPVETSQPLWDAPLALCLFVLLITTEWLVRKVYGMV